MCLFANLSEHLLMEVIVRTSLFRSIITTALLGIAAAGSLCAMSDGKEAKAARNQNDPLPYEKSAREALFASAQAGHWEAIPTIKALLHGHRIGYQGEADANGNNALHYAANAHNIAMFKLIRAICPALANQKNANQQYPIELLPSIGDRLRCIPYSKQVLGLLIGLGMFWLYRIYDYVVSPGDDGFIAANRHLGYPSFFVAIAPLVYLWQELHVYHDPAPVTRPL
jgi:hypothetical protein